MTMSNNIRRNILLIEMHQIQTMILEARMDFLKNTYVPKLQKLLLTAIIPLDLLATLDTPRVYNKMSPEQQLKAANMLFDWIMNHDPTSTKKYTQWLLTIVTKKKNPTPLEDITYADESINEFEQVKNSLPPDKRDINKFKSLSELNQILSSQEVGTSEIDIREKQEAIKHTKVYYNDSEWTVLSPLTKEAAFYWSRYATWCTAWGDPKGMYPTRTNNYFDQYIKKGPLYIIIHKNHPEKVQSLQIAKESPDTHWQFQFESNEFKDAQDKQINIDNFFKNYPTILKVFEDIDGEPYSYIEGNPVFKTTTGYVIKNKKGPFSTILGQLIIDDNILSHRSGWKLHVNSISEFLNNEHIKGDEDNLYHNNLYDNILYYHNGVWGTIDQVGDTFIKIDLLTEWKMIERINRYDIGLVEDNKLLMSGYIEDNEFIMFHNTINHLLMNNTRQLKPEYSKCLLILLLNDTIPITKFDDLNIIFLTKEDSDILVKEKPQLATIPLLHKANPDNPIILEKIQDWCDENDLTYIECTDDKLLIEEFKNCDDLVSSIGNDTVTWINDVLNGKRLQDISSETATTDEIIKFIDKLPNDSMNHLRNYLKNQYPEYSDDSWETGKSIIQTIEEDDYEELKYIANMAKTSGEETGTEDEEYKALIDAITDNNNILMKNKSDEIVKEFTWDNKFILFLYINDIIDFIINEGDTESAANVISYEGWKVTFNLKIDIKEPYYGFSGYDESAANERFSELVMDL